MHYFTVFLWLTVYIKYLNLYILNTYSIFLLIWIIITLLHILHCLLYPLFKLLHPVLCHQGSSVWTILTKHSYPGLWPKELLSRRSERERRKCQDVTLCPLFMWLPRPGFFLRLKVTALSRWSSPHDSFLQGSSNPIPA